MKEKQIKEQIRFMCKLSDIKYDNNFIDFVYDKHLNDFSGEILKKLLVEYNSVETIKGKLDDLEMLLEWFDNINVIQGKIHEISVLMKGNKDKELQNKFDNLIKHFRKVYLGI